METNIHTFVAPEEGRFAGSHFLKTPSGLFLFDTQLFQEYNEALLEQIEVDIGSREVARVFVTGAQPEHYLGCAYFKREAKARVSSTKRLATRIAQHGEKELKLIRSLSKKRLPRSVTPPSGDVKNQDQYRWKGLTLSFHDLGPAQNTSNLVCFVKETRSLIAGDLVFNRVHPDLTNANIAGWRSVLRTLQGFGAKKVFPGHGQPCGPDIMAHLARYLEHFQMAVSYFSQGKRSLSPEDRNSILIAICDKYPDYQLPANAEAGIAAEFARQKQLRAA